MFGHIHTLAHLGECSYQTPAAPPSAVSRSAIFQDYSTSSFSQHTNPTRPGLIAATSRHQATEIVSSATTRPSRHTRQRRGPIEHDNIPQHNPRVQSQYATTEYL